MAFNISITKRGIVDWNELLEDSRLVDREFASVFPIIRNHFVDESGVGVSVNNKKDYSSFWPPFEQFLKTLLDKDFKIVELYNGRLIDETNLDNLKSYFIQNRTK